MISSFHVDIAICSCKGLNEELYVTDSNEQDSEIKKAFLKSANRKVLAVDSSKFDKTSFVKVCDITNIDTVVTDANPGDVWSERIKNAGAELIFAE